MRSMPVAVFVVFIFFCGTVQSQQTPKTKFGVDFSLDPKAGLTWQAALSQLTKLPNLRYLRLLVNGDNTKEDVERVLESCRQAKLGVVLVPEATQICLEHWLGLYGKDERVVYIQLGDQLLRRTDKNTLTDLPSVLKLAIERTGKPLMINFDGRKVAQVISDYPNILVGNAAKEYIDQYSYRQRDPRVLAQFKGVCMELPANPKTWPAWKMVSDKFRKIDFEPMLGIQSESSQGLFGIVEKAVNVYTPIVFLVGCDTWFEAREKRGDNSWFEAVEKSLKMYGK